MFDRIIKVIGTNNLNKFNTRTVLIIGIGGVGGYTVEVLARSGIGNLIIIDPDIVDITNLNRQIISMHSTIGMKKVEVLKQRILDINPDCEVTKYDTFLNKENVKEIIKDVDYVVDACDTVTTKLEIIKHCLNENIKFISCMGTGNRLDPSMLEVTDIKKTINDPLAKIMRKLLKENNIKQKFPVVCSKELPVKIQERTPGSLIMVPSVAGILCASFVINDILKK